MTLQTKPWTSGQKTAAAAVLLAQFAAAYAIGTSEVLANTTQAFFAPIAITAIIPVAAFLAAYAGSARFRNFVLAQDIRILTTLHLWRVVGFVFLALYAVGHLPAVFAIPAGVGDVAVGIAAAFVIARTSRDPEFISSRRFTWFHYAGLADFATAITTAALGSGALAALVPNGITSAPMDVWPLNIFPSFIVPGFIIAHLMVLLKLRALRRAEALPAAATVQPA